MKFTDTVDQNFREGLPIRVASLHSKMLGAVLWPWLSTRTLGYWGKYSHHRTGALRVRPPPPQLLLWTQFHDCSAGKWTKSRAESCWTEGGEIQSSGLLKRPEWLARCSADKGVDLRVCRRLYGMTSLACASWGHVGLLRTTAMWLGTEGKTLELNRSERCETSDPDPPKCTKTEYPKCPWEPTVMPWFSVENGPMRTKLRNERT